MRKQLYLVAIATTALVGCGSGGGGDDNFVTPVTEAIPASAGQSSGGFIEYLRVLVASSADQLEPVNIGAFTAPTTEQEEPV